MEGDPNLFPTFLEALKQLLPYNPYYSLFINFS